MNKFFFKKTYHYVIYGAAIMGKIVLKGMLAAGYNIEAFLDRRAADIKNVDGIHVYRPEQYVLEDKDNTVIIIAITNPFEHTIVADYLSGLGYRKIVYTLFPGIRHPNNDIDALKNAYQKIKEGIVKESDYFCEYSTELLDLQFEDGSMIHKANDEIVAMVPVELCCLLNDLAMFKTTPQDSPDYYERRGYPMFMSCFEIVNFFKAVFGQQIPVSEATNAFVNYWAQNSSPGTDTFPRTKEGAQDLLINRNNVFWGMYRAFQQSGLGFFEENPIDVVWNDGGYFNVTDGQHRTCFMLALGFSFIPARMSKKDYQRWVNKDKLAPCLSFIKEKHIACAYAPIPHPNFRFFPAYRDIGGNTRLQKIGEFLVYNHIQFKGKRVLDAGSYYCYLSQFFARLGAQVTAVEYNPDSSEFGRRLNELLHCSSIESVCCGLDAMDTTKRFSFTIMLTVLYPYIDEPLGLKIIQNVDVVTENFLIWESGDYPEKEIQFIQKNSGFSKYIKICETYGTGKIREIGVFYKQHVDLELQPWIKY